MKWNERLRFERRSRGWTQSRLAEKIGANPHTVNRWEKGTAFPQGFYREKLTALFGINLEEKDYYFPQALSKCDHNIDEPDSLPSETEQVDDEHDPNLPLSAPAAQPQLVISLVQDDQAYKREMHSDADHLFWPRPPRDSARSHSRQPTFRPHPHHHFSWPHLLILCAVLVTIQVMITVVPSFIRQPLSMTQSKPEKTYGPPLYPVIMQNADPSLQDTTQHLQLAFSAVYPQLVHRFALDPATAPKSVTVTLASHLSSPASISGTTISLSTDWMRQHPSDMGLLTHELTLLLEQYPTGAPAWFMDGIADYARYVYGPTNDNDWSLPDGVQPQESYQQGGGVAARFLLWLEQHTTLDVIDQLHHALQTKQSFSAVFDRLTHHTVDELWRAYQAQPSITLTPQQLYKTATSRKPLYQSSFHFHLSTSRDPNSALAQGLFLSNFAIQADITVASGDAAGFFFRSDGNGHYLGIYLYPNGWYNLWKPAQKSESTYNPSDPYHELASAFSPAIKQGLNQTNRLTVVVHKYTIYLYINSQFITQAADNTLSSGSIGPMISPYTPPTNVEFHNLQIF